jgi:head-tail adaptor
MPEVLGKLRFRIQLLKQETIALSNDSAATSEALVFKQSRKADARDLGDGPRHLSSHNKAEGTTHQFICRYNVTLLNRGLADHILHDGRIFEIMNVKQGRERQRFIAFTCKELGPESQYTITGQP